MRLADDSHLTYCLNIHPGEAWADQRLAIAHDACAVKAGISPDHAFGLGLRLGAEALKSLADPGAMDDLRTLLSEHDLYVFTINAFPYGPFHGQPVKTAVYAPDWSHPERLDYTVRAAECLAALLPEDTEGSISTVPVAYKYPPLTLAQLARACEQLADAAFALRAIAQRTGRQIHVGLEPEPDCLIETTPESISFFERSLLPLGSAWLHRHQGLTVQDAERVLRQHIGICFDTCHLAVQFESIEASLRLLRHHGIRLSKVQLSAALQTTTSQQAVYALFPFARDAVYLHQTKILQPDGTLESWRDLTPERLTTWNVKTAARPCRIHYHVPLDFAGDDVLSSTASLLTPAGFTAAREAGAAHFEIETYTFSVLPLAYRRRTLVENLIAEYRYCLGILPPPHAQTRPYT